MANQVHCAHILVKTESEAKAVLERIKKGEKFTNIATQVSLCPSGKKGGDLGKFSRASIWRRSLRMRRLRLRRARFSAIVKTEFGYHIIKWLE